MGLTQCRYRVAVRGDDPLSLLIRRPVGWTLPNIKRPSCHGKRSRARAQASSSTRIVQLKEARGASMKAHVKNFHKRQAISASFRLQRIGIYRKPLRVRIGSDPCLPCSCQPDGWTLTWNQPSLRGLHTPYSVPVCMNYHHHWSL